jgi:hypothetical protein
MKNCSGKRSCEDVPFSPTEFLSEIGLKHQMSDVTYSWHATQDLRRGFINEKSKGQTSHITVLLIVFYLLGATIVNPLMSTADLVGRILIPLSNSVLRYCRRSSNFVFASVPIFARFLQPTFVYGLWSQKAWPKWLWWYGTIWLVILL